MQGDEICENYGPIFFHSAKDDRVSRLEKQYWFKCRCEAAISAHYNIYICNIYTDAWPAPRTGPPCTK